jgi:hypothetical protein
VLSTNGLQPKGQRAELNDLSQACSAMMRCPTRRRDMTERALTRSKVVIIGGGGFGGVYAASRSRTNGSAQRSF